MAAIKELCGVMAQLNLGVGDVDGNTTRIIEAADKARSRHKADFILFPELAVGRPVAPTEECERIIRVTVDDRSQVHGGQARRTPHLRANSRRPPRLNGIPNGADTKGCVGR